VRLDDLLENALRGRRIVAPSFAFSMHKSGSSLLNGMIEAVCSQTGVPSISVPDVLFMHGVSEANWELDERLLPFFQRGLLFYGFRQLPEILVHPSVALAERKCVLLLRDPRDALVSQFYSFGDTGSHEKPKHRSAFWISNSPADAVTNIDEYVLHHAGYFKQKLELYRRHLNAETTIVFRYEEIFFDKVSFLERVFAHFEIEIPNTIIRLVAKEFDVRPSAMDPSKHIRIGYPGNFRTKLKAETICRLNDIFY
jgi:Sulfotransferase domain